MINDTLDYILYCNLKNIIILKFRCLMLLEELECTLLGLVTGLCEVLQRLLAGSAGLAAYNAPALVHKQVRLLQATAGVNGCAVEDLGACAHSDHTTSHRGGGVIAACVFAAVAAHVLACGGHLF
jgi:hypothetical protein